MSQGEDAETLAGEDLHVGKDIGLVDVGQGAYVRVPRDGCARRQYTLDSAL